MSHYALFHLPGTNQYVRISQRGLNPAHISHLNELGKQHGFVFAPFAQDAQHPVWLIEPDEVECCPLTEEPADDGAAVGGSLLPHDDHTEHETYALDFASFHHQVHTGRLRKIVLARSSRRQTLAPCNAEALFLKACRRYPQQFVALVVLPEAGTWLMASPETLLEQGDDGLWHTMALAGTMQTDSPFGQLQKVTWSDKNREEQHYVSTYVEEVLRRHATNISVTEPYTTRAAHLVHLRSDFTFRLSSPEEMGSLVADLHPTPAVCGIPKDEAFRFILSKESSPRRYYSGFCGPVGLDMGTHLFVSLRCMEIGATHITLHAGGGILSESTIETEWNETKQKMQTMLDLVRSEE